MKPTFIVCLLTTVVLCGQASSQRPGRSSSDVWTIVNTTKRPATISETWKNYVPEGAPITTTIAPGGEFSFRGWLAPVIVNATSPKHALKRLDGTIGPVYVSYPRTGHSPGVYRIIEKPVVVITPGPVWNRVGPHLKKMGKHTRWTGEANLGTYGEFNLVLREVYCYKPNDKFLNGKTDEIQVQVSTSGSSIHSFRLIETDSETNWTESDVLGKWSFDAKGGKITSGRGVPNYVHKPRRIDPKSWTWLVLEGSGAHYNIWIEVQRKGDSLVEPPAQKNHDLRDWLPPAPKHGIRYMEH